MLVLSVIGFALAAVYALVGAPDVALVAVVVETTLTLVFLAALARLPAGDGDLPCRLRAGILNASLADPTLQARARAGIGPAVAAPPRTTAR